MSNNIAMRLRGGRVHRLKRHHHMYQRHQRVHGLQNLYVEPNLNEVSNEIEALTGTGYAGRYHAGRSRKPISTRKFMRKY